MTKTVMNVPPHRLKVFVVGGGYDYIRMLYELGYSGAKGVGDADIVLFTGGEDVSPSLYGERPLKQTNFSTERDEYEKKIFEAAKEAGIPMVGICRGGQFLNVMSGGKMWQHVDNHCGNHAMMTKQEKVQRIIMVTSTHHQMMIPADDALILATAAKSKTKMSESQTLELAQPTNNDAEVLWYAKTNALCFQPHPEYGWAPPECRKYFSECMDNFVVPMTIQKGK